MSVKSDALDMGRKRKREVALKAALHKLEGVPGEAMAPAAAADASEGSADAIPSTLDDSSVDEKMAEWQAAHTPVPARVVDAKKAWEDRPGHQCRPLTRIERQAEEDRVFDSKMLKQWDNYCELSQRDVDENASEELHRQKRMAREERTGLRILPSSKDRGISLQRAQELGYIGGNSDED